MLGSMLSWRGIATSHMAAGETEPQMEPGAAGLETLLTPLRRVRLNRMNLIEMETRHIS
jgi:hypothetical protein